MQNRAVSRVANRGRAAIASLGKLSPHRLPHILNAAANYAYTGGWMDRHGYGAVDRFSTREEVYKKMADRVQSQESLYLEFGVWQGASFATWLELLDSPTARFVGFDSFEGLPESWNEYNQPGHFSTDGREPTVSDGRANFVKGYFEDSLPLFEVPAHEQLILNMDADLYSSTSFVLNRLAEWIVPGTLIYFDEFCDRLHELRAFEEFAAANELRFTPIAATRHLAHVAFECQGR